MRALTIAEATRVAEIEQDYRQTVCAVILDHDGTVYDHAFTWETAQSMALSDGYAVIAIADDGHMSKDEIQRLCDAERERHDDCFGVA